MAGEILTKYPELEDRFPRIPLIAESTPVHQLSGLGQAWSHPHLYVKREDQTHALYGGNKVRNLEFVLGQARRQNAKQLVTLVPYGSNFTAALSAHGAQAGMEVHLAQFVAQRNPQIEEHVAFCGDQGAVISNAAGLLGPVTAALRASSTYLKGAISGDVFWVTPGASNTLGALGHASGFLEMLDQVKAGLIPEPDVIVVGTGTTGTLAGLSAAAHLSGSKVKLIGVRCAEKIVCHPRRVRRLAASVIREVTGRPAPRVNNFEIVDVPTRTRYAVPCPEAFGAMRAFWERETISLDTTYTAKVGLYLQRMLAENEFVGRRVLYWHTYSPAVTCWDTARIRALELAQPSDSFATELSYA